MCVNAAGTASAYYTAASPAKYPVWIPITMTNGGAVKTAASKLVPVMTYLGITGTDAAIKINWIQLERIP
jgi:hypothetical protein